MGSRDPSLKRFESSDRFPCSLLVILDDFGSCILISFQINLFDVFSKNMHGVEFKPAADTCMISCPKYFETKRTLLLLTPRVFFLLLLIVASVVYYFSGVRAPVLGLVLRNSAQP